MTAFTLNQNRCNEDDIHQPSPLTNQPLIFSLHPSTYSTFKRCIDIMGSLIGQKQWHPGYDLMIIWKTIAVVFARLGAC